MYWGNHDQPRAVSRFGDDGEHRVASAKTLATVLHLHRGTPYVYQGDELGMTNSPFAGIDDYRDIETLNFHAAAVAGGTADLPDLLRSMSRMSRDHARTPMQWDASAQSGFTTGVPWIAVHPDHPVVNAAAQVDDPCSVFTHHRRLIGLRHTDPVVTDGEFTLLLPDHEQVWAFLRGTRAAELLVVANIGGEPVEVTLPLDQGWAGAEVVLGTVADPGRHPAPSFALRPWESVVLRRVRDDGAPAAG